MIIVIDKEIYTKWELYKECLRYVNALEGNDCYIQFHYLGIVWAVYSPVTRRVTLIH